MLYNVLPFASSGFVASAVIKTARGRVHWVFPYNQNAAARYVQIFDTTALPANGTTPLWMFPLPATGAPAKELAFPPDGLYCGTGIVIALSTTPSTLTIAGSDLQYTIGVS